MPDEEDGSFRAGMTAFREKQYEEAIVHFTRAVHEHPVIHKSFNALGVTYSKLGNSREAEACFKKALFIDPDNQTYEKNLGKISHTIVTHDNQEKPEKPKRAIQKPYRKRNIQVMVGVTLVVIILITLLSMQAGIDLQPWSGTFMKGSLQEGLLTPWMRSMQEDIRIFPIATIEVENKRIEFYFDRDQDLSTIERVEAVISITKDGLVQQRIVPTITRPGNNLYYAIDDPYPGKQKHLVMTVYYQDGVSGIIADKTLPPR